MAFVSSQKVVPKQACILSITGQTNSLRKWLGNKKNDISINFLYKDDRRAPHLFINNNISASCDMTIISVSVYNSIIQHSRLTNDKIICQQNNLFDKQMSDFDWK